MQLEELRLSQKKLEISREGGTESDVEKAEEAMEQDLPTWSKVNYHRGYTAHLIKCFYEFFPKCKIFFKMRNRHTVDIRSAHGRRAVDTQSTYSQHAADTQLDKTRLSTLLRRHAVLSV